MSRNEAHLQQSMDMLRLVLDGDSYVAVGKQFGLVPSSIESRVKLLAQRLVREVGIDALPPQATLFVNRMRQHRDALLTALSTWSPTHCRHLVAPLYLDNAVVSEAVARLQYKSQYPSRDVCLFLLLLATAAHQDEVAALQVRDVVCEDGSLRTSCRTRNRSDGRTLYLTSPRLIDALRAYLCDRDRHVASGDRPCFGLDPDSRLFPSAHVPLSRVIRRIFRALGWKGVTQAMRRRWLAGRLLAHGASAEQVGELLGIRHPGTLKRYLAQYRSLEDVTQGAV